MTWLITTLPPTTKFYFMGVKVREPKPKLYFTRLERGEGKVLTYLLLQKDGPYPNTNKGVEF